LYFEKLGERCSVSHSRTLIRRFAASILITPINLYLGGAASLEFPPRERLEADG
jgi:hypothetical protein